MLFQTYDNLTYQKLMETLEEAANLDHEDADCIVIAFLRLIYTFTTTTSTSQRNYFHLSFIYTDFETISYV